MEGKCRSHLKIEEGKVDRLDETFVQAPWTGFACCVLSARAN